MRRATVLVSVLALALLAAPAAAPGQDDDDGVLPQPSRWGLEDEAGNSNTQTPDKVLEAVKLIRTGEKYLLGHEYTPDMPLFPGNSWAMAAKGPVQVKRQVFNAEHFAAASLHTTSAVSSAAGPGGPLLVVPGSCRRPRSGPSSVDHRFVFSSPDS